MDCKGKILAVLGDSITAGVGVEKPENRFCERLRCILELQEVRCCGVSGRMIAAYRQEDGSWDEDSNFCAAALEMDCCADIIAVFGGTNDFGWGTAPLGCPQDTDTHTFCGACHVLMRELIERYPEAEIVILTPLHRSHETSRFGGGEKTMGDGEPLVRYVEALRVIAEWYSLPVLDLWAEGGIQPNVPAVAGRFCPDCLHPNDLGHKRLAERIAGFLKRY